MNRHYLKRVLAVMSLVLSFGCTGNSVAPAETASARNSEAPSAEPSETARPVSEENTGDIIILYTSDIHCGLKKGFGAVSLAQMRDTMEKQGNTVLLADNGDAIQGDSIGTITKGAAVISVMNALRYDVAIPGNHEFDFGLDEFLKRTQEADFPYISCNITRNDELMFAPYIIREVQGTQIAFIGVTTPLTSFSSSPAHFQDENGNTVCHFMADADGSTLFTAVQNAIDEVKEKGADYVFLMSHLGKDEIDAPFNFQTLLEHTEGIDVILDGHTHDMDQLTMNDKSGHPVIRSACGTKLQGIGWVKISRKDGSLSNGIYTWNNDTEHSEVFGITNEVSGPIQDVYDALSESMNVKIAESEVTISIYDPVNRDSSGKPVRICRLQETNMGDFITDSLRIQTGADISFVNASSLRDEIIPGDVTYEDIMRLLPFSNTVCVSEITGQDLLDALEWGARNLPKESGFLCPSGFSYEIDATIPSPCTVDTDGHFSSAEGKRRVSNVLVRGEPVDPEKTYTVASISYLLYEGGGGYTMFDDGKVTKKDITTDSECMIDYIRKDLGGVIGKEYRDVHGQGRLFVRMPE